MMPAESAMAMIVLLPSLIITSPCPRFQAPDRTRPLTTGHILRPSLLPISRLRKRFSFPARSFSAIPLLAEYFVKKGIRKAFALSPDKGALHIARQAQQILGGDCGHLDKQRDRYSGQTSQTGKGLDVKGKTVVIFDDIISTGGTIVGAAKILRELGATHVFTACVHPLLIGDAEKRILDAGVEEIVGTDSVPSGVSKVSLAPLISEELKAFASG